MSKIKSTFPYEVFPYEIIELLENALETLSFPISYLSTSILSACSTAIGNTYQLKFKETWLEKTNLYMVLVGRAGDIKSHPLNFTYKYLNDIDKENYQTYKIKLEEYNQLSLEDKKTKQKPFFKQSIISDFTPEAMIKIHSNNKRGIVILADELFGWINNFGRYSKSGEEQMYLTLFNGQDFQKNLKDEATRLNDPHLNIAGTMQTKLLHQLGANNRSDNGFLDRFLFVLEDANPVLWNEKELCNRVINSYTKLMQKLLSLEFTDFNPNIIEFTNESKKAMIAWQTKKRKEFIDDEVSNGIQAKIEIYALRFSLLIQLIFWAMSNRSKDKVELFAVENAIKLAEYFFANAKKVNRIILNPISNLSQVQKNLYDNLSNEFSTKEILTEGEKLNIPKRNITRFLTNKNIFTKVKQGLYKKI